MEMGRCDVYMLVLCCGGGIREECAMSYVPGALDYNNFLKSLSSRAGALCICHQAQSDIENDNTLACSGLFKRLPILVIF